MRTRFLFLLLCGLLAGLASAKPALYLIGDSTVRNSTPGQQGWGDPLGVHFDPTKIDVHNRAIGGRSSRTFLAEGRWAAVTAHLKQGDYVIMQFGHNDGGEMFAGDRPRASIKGNGDETKSGVVEATGEEETVRSFGAYLRTYCEEAKAKGATPIVVSLIPRNIWREGKVVRASGDYGRWAKEAAEQAGAEFIDFNALIADRYEELGQEKVAAFFTAADHTHTNREGAAFNATVLADAILELEGCKLRDHLLPRTLWLPSIFSDHMVLQRDRPLPVWGTAGADSPVTVTLGGKSATATADADGDWRVELPALPAGGPLTMEISAGTETRTFSDVWVGEVWLCSGQSNMDFTMAPTEKRHFAGVTDWENEVAAADHPRIRTFSAEWTMHEFPQRDVEGVWMVCSPETAGDFSAVALYFAKELEATLDVPVGLVTCAYGASTIEAWIREEKLQENPEFEGLMKAFDKKRLHFRDNPQLLEDYGSALARWEVAAEKARTEGQPAPRRPKHPDPVQDQHNPFVLHNGMIAPVAPFAIRGAIWYQGESNQNTRKLYPALQQALIEDWREIWEDPEMPFYFTQLAAYRAPASMPQESALAEMREAQAASLGIPNTGMAVTIDIGDEKDIHPRNKRDVGKRLARLALAGTYGHSVAPCGPMFREAKIEGDRIRVHFDASSPLVANGGPLRHFAIAGADRSFAWADAVVDGSSVIVFNEEIAEPRYVRYAWADHPEGANLFDADGLPAAPFRTDAN